MGGKQGAILNRLGEDVWFMTHQEKISDGSALVEKKKKEAVDDPLQSEDF